MAQRIVIQLVDDLTGEEIADGEGESVSFGLDGRQFTIDLTSANADRLRGSLEEYVAVAAVAGPVTRRSGRAPGQPSSREMRDWARVNGYQVPDRGRVPTSIRDAFLGRR